MPTRIRWPGCQGRRRRSATRGRGRGSARCRWQGRRRRPALWPAGGWASGPTSSSASYRSGSDLHLPGRDHFGRRGGCRSAWFQRDGVAGEVLRLVRRPYAARSCGALGDVEGLQCLGRVPWARRCRYPQHVCVSTSGIMPTVITPGRPGTGGRASFGVGSGGFGGEPVKDTAVTQPLIVATAPAQPSPRGQPAGATCVSASSSRMVPATSPPTSAPTRAADQPPAGWGSCGAQRPPSSLRESSLPDPVGRVSARHEYRRHPSSRSRRRSADRPRNTRHPPGLSGTCRTRS